MKEISEINYNAKPAFYVMCMESLRKIAAKCGYALAVHGSCANDLDLIAVRWAENYESPKFLVTELVKEISHYSFYESENTDFIELTGPTFRYKNQIHYAIPIYHNYFVDLTVIQDVNEIEIFKDQIESLQAALIAKEETHRIKIGELKEKALNAFLECEGYDEFEREINS